MKPRDHRDLAALLLDKAATDAAVVAELRSSERVPDEVVGFHAQQACEKTLKAVLAARDIRYRYTHDLAELVDQVRDEVGDDVPDALEVVVALTPFAVAYRYEDIGSDDDALDRDAVLAQVEALQLGGGAHRLVAGLIPPQRSAVAGRASHTVHNGRYPRRGQNTDDSGLGGL